MSGVCTESTIQTRYKTECFCFFVARAPLPAVRNYKSVPPHACDAGKNLGKASDANKNHIATPRTAHHLPWFFFLLSTTILTTIHFTLCSSLLASRGCEHHIASRGCETESIHISCVCSVCDTHLACRTAAVQLTPGM